MFGYYPISTCFYSRPASSDPPYPETKPKPSFRPTSTQHVQPRKTFIRGNAYHLATR